MQILPWIVASVASLLLAASLAAWAWFARTRRRQQDALPAEWGLSPRPVFSADERRVYRLLREALPHHVLLPKLPLLRFCQPTDPGEARYWHDLLGQSQVGFAICSANGRVLAAIDLDSDRGGARRLLQIKQAALGACRVRYVRCAVDQLPSVAELQLLVPSDGIGAHSPQPTPQPRPTTVAPRPARSDLPSPRRSPRPVLWQDTTVFQDSFFPADDGVDDASTETFEPASGRRAASGPRTAPTRLVAAAERRHRAPPPADFAPTRQILEDDEDEDDDGGHDDRAGRGPRFRPGYRP